MRTKKTSYSKTDPKPQSEFERLVTQIPVRLFTQMVGKAQLPAKESRQLCRLFMGMKAK